jgi:Zn-dependent protease
MAAERKGAIEIFKVAGIQVAIDYSWLIIFALILWSLSSGYFPTKYPGYSTGSYWLVGLVASILFFGSVLAHELCQAAMGNRLGEEVSAGCRRRRPGRRRKWSARRPDSACEGSCRRS